MNVKAGDVIAVESKSFVGRQIEKAQLRLGYTKEQARVTHIAIAINSLGSILEEEGKGVRLYRLDNYNEAGIKYHILRHKEADPEVLSDMAIHLSHINDFSYRNYDFLLVIGLFFFSIGMPISWLKYFNNKARAICSEYVLEIFKKCGIIKPKEQKLYLPAEWVKWRDEKFFKEIKQG